MARVRLTAAMLFVVLAGAIRVGIAQTSGNVSVSGGILLRDGRPWEPKGVVVTGLVSAASTAGPVGPAYVTAREIWGSAEIAAIKRYGADTIDLKVSQPALDPLGGNYLTKIKAAVSLARKEGLSVILSMKWGEQTGVAGQLDMPSDESVTAPLSSTARAWQILAPGFGSDQGVMYQLFDEPCAKQDSPQVWAHWQSGHQSAINAIRRTGAKNILIVEGIRCAKWLTQVPALNDPLHPIVYGVHPYQMPQGVRPSNADMFTAADFDRNFGQWQAKGNVVITTEWDIWDATCHDGSDGNPTSPKIAAALLDYLKSHHTGLVVWAMDLPGTIWVDRNWRFLTRLLPFDGCHGAHIGVGAMVRDYFKTGQTVPK
jgi:endoglucanase